MDLERLLLILFILASALAFFFPVKKRYDIIQALKGGFETKSPEKRFFRFLAEVCLQSKVIIQRPLPGLMSRSISG